MTDIKRGLSEGLSSKGIMFNRALLVSSTNRHVIILYL